MSAGPRIYIGFFLSAGMLPKTGLIKISEIYPEELEKELKGRVICYARGRNILLINKVREKFGIDLQLQNPPPCVRLVPGDSIIVFSPCSTLSSSEVFFDIRKFTLIEY